MTLIISSEGFAEELRVMKDSGAITAEIMQECRQLLLPASFLRVLTLLSVSYLMIGVAGFFSGNLSSGIAAMGPMLTGLYMVREFGRRSKR